MKKSLLGFSVALAAFSFGVLTANLFFPAKDFAIHEESTKIEAAKIETLIVTDQNIPQFKVGQLTGTEEIEEIEFEPIEPETIYGWYSLDGNYEMPEVNVILLNQGEDAAVNEYDRDSAGIYTRLSDDIDEGFAKAINPVITKDKVKFTTKKVKGVEYRFEGTFFKGKTVGKRDEGILRGTLQKYIKGRKVAEIHGNFTYSEPYCLH